MQTKNYIISALYLPCNKVLGLAPHLPRDVIIPEIVLTYICSSDCGATYITDIQLRANVKECAQGHLDNVEDLNFGAFDEYVLLLWQIARIDNLSWLSYSLHASIKQDVALLKKSPYLGKELAESVTGFAFDIKTGLVEKVVA